MLAGVEPLKLEQPVHRASTAWSRVVANFYFHGIVGAAQVVARFAPTLSRR